MTVRAFTGPMWCRFIITEDELPYDIAQQGRRILPQART